MGARGQSPEGSPPNSDPPSPVASTAAQPPQLNGSRQRTSPDGTPPLPTSAGDIVTFRKQQITSSYSDRPLPALDGGGAIALPRAKPQKRKSADLLRSSPLALSSSVPTLVPLISHGRSERSPPPPNLIPQQAWQNPSSTNGLDSSSERVLPLSREAAVRSICHGCSFANGDRTPSGGACNHG